MAVSIDDLPVSTTVSAFYMDVTEVTLSQWQAVYFWAKENGYTDLPAGSGKGANHPVHTVTWYDCVKWCNARSEQAGLTPVYYTDDAQTTVYRAGNVDVTNAQVKWDADGYRLPTEAEWEKAARGVDGRTFPWGEVEVASLAKCLNSFDERAQPEPIGAFETARSVYGVGDAVGGMWTWTASWFDRLRDLRALRGGSWAFGPTNLRCAVRGREGPDFRLSITGFRCARGLRAL